MGPSLKLVQVPLDGIPSLRRVDAPLSLLSSASLLRVHSILLSMSLMKILNRYSMFQKYLVNFTGGITFLLKFLENLNCMGNMNNSVLRSNKY